MANILVVDDELGIRDLLSEILNDEGHAVELAENAAQARAARNASRPDLVLLDIWMPDTDGVSLLKEWAATNLLTMPVIMMSGHATIDTAVEATRIGAQAFLEKPITMQKLLKAVEQGLMRNQPTKPMVANVQMGMGGSLGGQLGGNHLIGGAVAAFSSLPDLQYRNGMPSSSLSSSSMQPMLHAEAPTGPQSRQSFDLDRPLREARDGFERCYFEFHLMQEGGSMTRVAEKTGLERTHLYRKLKQLGVDLSRGKRL